MVAEAYLSVQFAIDERAEQGWIVHTYQVIDRLQSVLNDVQEAETGQRGFIITQQPRFLEPYYNGIRKAHADLAVFDKLTADNPGQRARGRVLRELVEARFKALDTVLTRAKLSASASPPVVAAMDEGKAKMDGLRRVLSLGMAEEGRLLKDRSEARRRIERNEVVSTTMAALVALFVLLTTALLLVRSNFSLARSEEALANESAILHAALNTIRDGIAMFSSDGRLCAFNSRFFELLGVPPVLARPGTPLSDLQAIESSRDAIVLDDAFLRGEGDQDYRRVSVGNRDLDVYRAAVATGGYIVVCNDVTERLAAEQAARQAQKMEAIGHLTGGVAHDFNNLLQIIGTNLDRVDADLPADSRNHERLRSAIEAVGRGARLTGQLLAFARRQALDPRSTNVGRVIQDMTDLLRRTLGERVEVESIIAGGLWNTFVDPNQIESAILNLAINARDAMPDGGKLTLEVANAFLDDAYAALHDEVSPGQYVMVGVSDTGAGMSAGVVARAFEPFFTTKPEGRGTGLGLSQVYGFVKQSGGHIKIYSEIGQGTTIKLYLPRTRKPQEGTGPVATQAVRGGTERILVVEDDAQVRAAAVDTLSELGYAVLKAENAEQALAILASGAAVDMLFTDVVMPGPISTRELARRAQEMQPAILVLYTSGYTQNAIVHNGKLDDDAVLLSKPYRRDELARKLRAMFDARRDTVPLQAPAQQVRQMETPKKVLVVEDNALIRMTTVEMVEELGHVTAEAGTGPAALEILGSDAEIAIMLTDLGLPGMSGRELVAEALKVRPGLKIVIVSGYSAQDVERGANEAYLMKPFDIEQLRRVL